MDDEFEEFGKTSDELANNYTPCIGMEFDSEEDAFRFYNEYGRIKGFSIRRDYHTKSRKDGIMINRKFVCCKEGERQKDKREREIKQHRQETRTNCEAFMYVSLKREINKWIVAKFDDNHNHDLHLSECTHMMPSQRKLCGSQGFNIELNEDTGISLKASHDLISAQAGGKEFVGFTREDQKSYLRARRQRTLQYGEAGSLLRYFQNQQAENPYFYYAFQLDADEMITNIFWADHQMITDYEYFGDVISFDTTFKTNKNCRPFACFVGFNHFRITVIFGAALLYDETTASFEWLFETFLHAMSGKKPATIFTDQDQAMAKAIAQVMPDVKHGLCTFHLMQNALKHLGNLFKGGSNFGSDLKACVYGYEDEEELIKAWDSLIDKYHLHDNAWLKKTWEIREKWAHVYLKFAFTAGMRSTQLSESMNGALKKYLSSDHNIVQFFTHFNRIVVDKRYREIEAIYHSRQKLPRMKMKMSPMLAQAARLYTHPIFELFHNEFDVSLCCQVKQCHELEREHWFMIGLYGEDRVYTVIGNVDEKKICCTCRKFENFGILCGHAIKVLDRMNIMEIPESYILGRWRIDARDCAFKGGKVVADGEDPKLVISTRYKQLCPKMIQLAARSSEDEATYQLVYDTIDNLCGKVNKMIISQDVSSACSSGGTYEVETMGLDAFDPNLAQVKGLKKKDDTHRGGRRLRAWHDKMGKRKKKISHPTCNNETFDQSGDTINVQKSFLDQPQDVAISYWPQTMSDKYIPIMNDITSVCPPTYAQMAHLSSQSSHIPTTSEGMIFDPTEHTTTREESLFYNDNFFNFFQ